MSRGGHKPRVLLADDHLDVLDRVVDGLAVLFDSALRRGDATCVIATEEVREGLDRRLRERGWAVSSPPGHARYLAVDAAAVAHAG